jgi:hypothetical protein
MKGKVNKLTQLMYSPLKLFFTPYQMWSEHDQSLEAGLKQILSSLVVDHDGRQQGRHQILAVLDKC